MKKKTRIFASALSVFAKNVHDDSNNERRIISVVGVIAIVESDSREEWIECEPNDPARGIRIDGKTYRYKGEIK